MFMSIFTVSRSNSVYTKTKMACVSEPSRALVTQIHPRVGGENHPQRDRFHRRKGKASYSLVQFPKPNQKKKVSHKHMSGQIVRKKRGRTINQSRLQLSHSDRPRPIRVHRRKPMPKLRVRTRWWSSLGRGLLGVPGIGTSVSWRGRAGISSVALIAVTLIVSWNGSVRLAIRWSMVHLSKEGFSMGGRREGGGAC